MLFPGAWPNLAALQPPTWKLKASMHPPESLEQLAEEFHTIFTSMKSPKRKRISNVKAGVLIVD
jgi:hypothetical protein